MAASDQNYRSQRALDIVFGVSSVLMLLSVVWMFAQDYFRDYKVEQRQFRDVESAIANRQMIAMVPDQETLDAIKATQEKLANALTVRGDVDREYRPKFDAISTDKVKSYNAYQAVKADYDSEMSLLNIAVEDRNKFAAGTPEYQHHEEKVKQMVALTDKRRKQLAEALVADEKNDDKIKALQAEQKETIRKRLEEKGITEEIDKIEDELKRLTVDFDRFAKQAVQKKWRVGDTIRELPVLDAFASPVRIHQFTLTDLPIDYNFKYVTRFDRCMTCHQGIDRPAYTKVALQELTQPLDKDMQERLKKAEGVFADRRKILHMEEESFDSSQIASLARQIEISGPRINEFAAHPRLDLFVDASSPHPAEKFGCTVCHGGQGTATDFVNAVHTPTSLAQKARWEKDNSWVHIHDWEFPMLPKRFQESSCLKCHYQVVELLPDGNKTEYRDSWNAKEKKVVKEKQPSPGAKVVAGYNLIRENGCFGCHEISGSKGGRKVGPDLRLEPNPPVDSLSPTERAKLYADPANPPGAMRKVGPSLRRINDKTNEEWVRKWINSPRGYRPDTKMPHFYNLSTNNKEYLAATAPDQKDYPDAEIHSIAFYLFQHSKAITEEKKQPSFKLPGDFKADATKGRALFTERGCLACHKHEKTEEAQGDFPKVVSEAHFGPNLTRLADKLGDKPGDDKARNWLVNWVKDPTFYHPRTFMPVTHLSDEDAANIAAWLLEQKSDWKADDVPKPEDKVFQSLARVYLAKNLTTLEADELFKPENANQLADKLQKQLDESDRKLGEKLDAEGKLKLYIGRKAINQLGCFGCHDIPGFENAKPIGTPLNDWGKKDTDRIAFEDINAYVKKTHFPEKEVKESDAFGKEHYERYFFDALQAHQRDGFLQQKLREPRSYDYDRVKAWDERLRMPQFRFARNEAKPKDENETEEQARDRAEAEAREQVMTFVLGLLAEPIPSKYVYSPQTEKAAIVKGKAVLDKFNCAGCHQLRPGVFEFNTKPTYQDGEKKSLVLSALDAAQKKVGPNGVDPKDYVFANHNAWVGQLSANPDIIRAHGLPLGRDESDVNFRLTEAVRFVPEEVQKQIDEGKIPSKDRDKHAKDVPASETIGLPISQVLAEGDPWGGTFVDLLAPYLVARKTKDLDDDPKARSGLPPPLLREGEKVQPDWLFRFLKNPYKIRELTILRMPRFNMSEEEAMALANYFAAVDRLSNPRMGLDYPYFPFPQRQDGFLQEKSAAYVAKLKKEDLEKRVDKMKEVWKELLPDQEKEFTSRIADLKKAVEEAKKAEDKAQGAEKERLKKDREATEKRLQDVEKEAESWKKLEAQPKSWEQDRIYATDAFRLLVNNDLCLACHQVGSHGSKPIGPRLDVVSDRLRPEWTRMWLAAPQRMMVYPKGAHPMPQNFPNGEIKLQDVFNGPPLDQVTGIRDVLMLYPKVADMPEDRKYRPAQAAPQGAKP